MFSVCENTNLKGNKDEFGDMKVVHCGTDAWVLCHLTLATLGYLADRAPLEGGGGADSATPA